MTGSPLHETPLSCPGSNLVIVSRLAPRFLRGWLPAWCTSSTRENCWGSSPPCMVFAARKGEDRLRKDRPLIRTVGRIAMRSELEGADVIGELLAFWLEEDGNPPDMVLGRIRMPNLLPDHDLNGNGSPAFTSAGHSMTGTCFSVFQSAVSTRSSNRSAVKFPRTPLGSCSSSHPFW